MDSNITSSFIPKDTVQSGGRKPVYASGLGDLLMLAGVILFVAAVALSIGVFLYLQFEEASLTSKGEQLQRAQEAFEPALIAELTRLDDRMNAAEDVLYNHIAPSELFNTLEKLTLKGVSFSSLNFQATDRNTMSMSLKGIAHSVNAIALQADLFGKNTGIVSPIFSNINRTGEGVLFEVSSRINPTAIRYVNVSRNTAAAASAENVPVQTGQQPVTEQEAVEEDGSIPLFAP